MLWQSFRHDLRLYGRLISMQIRAQLQYRASVAIDIGTFGIVTALEFTAILLYFNRFQSILGWHVGEVTLLAAFVALGASLADAIGSGIDMFDEVIRRGEFDRVLLRPVGTFVQILGSDVRLRKLGRMASGLLLFALSLHLLPGLHWTPLKLLVIPLGILTNVGIFLGILLLGATLCFWTIETTELVNIPFDGGREMMNYPLTIYNGTLQRVFLFLVPLAFGAFLPTCYILDRPFPFGLPAWIVFLGPIVALAFVAVALALWHLGTRRYQSTGS
jgi:ABC-2 type transport system permease protein